MIVFPTRPIVAVYTEPVLTVSWATTTGGSVFPSLSKRLAAVFFGFICEVQINLERSGTDRQQVDAQLTQNTPALFDWRPCFSFHEWNSCVSPALCMLLSWSPSTIPTVSHESKVASGLNCTNCGLTPHRLDPNGELT